MIIENAQNHTSKELAEKGFYTIQRLTYIGGERDGQIAERALDYESSLRLRQAARRTAREEKGASLTERNDNAREFTMLRECGDYSIRYDFYSTLPRGCCADCHLTFDRESGEWLDGEQYRAKLAQ